MRHTLSKFATISMFTQMSAHSYGLEHWATHAVPTVDHDHRQGVRNGNLHPSLSATPLPLPPPADICHSSFASGLKWHCLRPAFHKHVQVATSVSTFVTPAQVRAARRLASIAEQHPWMPAPHQACGIRKSGPASIAGSTAAAMQLVQRREYGAGAARRRCTARRQWANTVAVWALVTCCSWLLWSPAHAAETPAQAAQRVGLDAGPIGVAAQSLLPPLNTFVVPGGYLGTDNVSLGNTTFRQALAFGLCSL